MIFNQDISDWDVSQVTDMSYLFGTDGGGGDSISRDFNEDIRFIYRLSN